MKHTKGKWMLPHLVDDKATCNCGYVLCEQYCGAIATVHWSKNRDLSDGDNPPLEEAKANAKLITAAPELLEALTIIEGAFWTDGESNDFKINDLKQIARIAIKNATQ